MKLCRFQPRLVPAKRVGAPTHPSVLQGVIEGDAVSVISGDILGKWSATGTKWPLADVKMLPPATPSKIVCVGKNYGEHAAEMKSERPAWPIIFLKPPTSVLPPEEPIVLPPESNRVDHEGELGVIIGKTCYLLAEGADVRPYIAGYTCVNDVTARDLQAADQQWTRGKGFDTFCPFGPVMETAFDPASGELETRVNNVRKQHSPLNAMLFPVDVIIHWISRVMTLLPGDLIATGTPSGVGPLHPGDIVEVTINGIGTLRNPVIARPSKQE